MNKLMQKLQKTNSEEEILAVLEDAGYSRDEVFVGNLRIERNTIVNYRIVTGGFAVQENATLNAPKLQLVGTCVYLYENATLEAPNIEVIGDSVTLWENTTLTMSNLKVVGNYVHLHKNATLKAPNLEVVVNWVHVNPKATLIVPKLKSYIAK